MNNKGLLTASLAMLMAAPQAYAGTTINDGEDRYITIGAGLRTSFNRVEDAAPSGNDYSNDFELDSIRLYLSGQIAKNIKFTFNTERDSQSDVRVIDGIAQFEFNDAFNIWAGRFLPPSDRSNFSGPYYLGTFDFPIAQAYPNIIAGRDEGIAVWGHVLNDKLKYQFGVFEGSDGTGSANEDDNLLYAGKLTINFWEPEGGYYNASTYFGEKEIFTLGLVAMQQDDASGTIGNSGDFFGYSADVLMETKISTGGTVTLEGAYYDYDLDDRTFSGTTNGPAQGDGYFVLGGYLFPQKVGIGRFQPHFRYEEFDADGGLKTERSTLGVTYVIKGHDARITAVAGETEVGSTDTNFFRVGLQLQY